MARQKKQPKAKQTKPPRIGERYVCPGLSEQDAQIAGPALRAIAEKHKVNDIRSLTAEIVWSEIEHDRHHPLRQLPQYNVSQHAAARAHFVEVTRRIISGIRIVTLDMPKRKAYEPMFLAAEAPTKQDGSSAVRRSHVLRADVLQSDPIFMSALGNQLRRMMQALAQAEHLVSARPVPMYVDELLRSLREALNRYHGVNSNESAAE